MRRILPVLLLATLIAIALLTSAGASTSAVPASLNADTARPGEPLHVTGRVLVQAPRDEAAVLVADLDLDQRRDWLALFPFLTTRRPDAYGSLAAT